MKKYLLGLASIIWIAVSAQVPTNGLIAYYPFNAGSTADLSGNGNNGTNYGATLTTDHLGNPNSAYRFNGNGQYIEVPHSSTFNFSSNQMSISMWVKVEAFPPGSFTSIAVSKQSGSGTTQSGFNINQGSQTSFGLLLSSGGANFGGSTVPSNSTTLNTFRHVVFTYDGTTARAYLNGTISQTSSSQTATIGANTVPLRLGKANWVNINAVDFTGVLDDIAIYNRVLTPQEVSSIYSSCPNTSATINPQSSTTFCQGGSVLLQASSGSSYSWSTGATSQSITATQSNTYSVTVTDGNGCTATASRTVTVNPTPTAVINASGATTFCQGGSVSLTATGGGNYSWSTGATSQSITVTQSNTYSVTVTDGNGCTATASRIVTVNSNPTVSFSLPTYTSINAPSFAMNGNPSGGSYTGAGVNGSNFNPSNAGLGLKNVSYTYTDGNGCIGVSSSNTIVFDTTGVLCTSYDTVTTNVFDTTNVTVYDTITTTQTIYDTVTTYLSVNDTLKINVNLTGIAPPQNTNTLTVYPNPTHDHLLIENGNLSSMNGYSIKITNTLGQIVFNQPVTQQSFYIDLSTWGGNGTYFLYVIDPNQTVKEIKKIVLQ